MEIDNIKQARAAERDDARRSEMARILGVTPDSIGSVAGLSTMRRLLSRGVLVQVSLNRWRAKSRLTGRDLGIDSRLDSDLIRLGEKLLLPRDIIRRLDNIDSQARHNLADNSYQTFAGHFVTEGLYPRFKAVNDRLRAEYIEVADRLLRDDAKIRDSMTDIYTAQAEVAWERIKTQGLAPSLNKAEFVGAAIERVMQSVPDAATIRQSFAYTTRLSMMPILAISASTGAQLTDLIKSDLGAQDATAAQDIDAVLTTAAVSIRELLSEAVANVSESLKKNGKLVGKASQQLRNLLATLQGLNFWDDPDVTQAASQIKELLAERRYTSAESMTISLNDIRLRVRESLVALGEIERTRRDNTISADDISAEPVIEFERRQRYQMEITKQDTAAPIPTRQRRGISAEMVVS